MLALLLATVVAVTPADSAFQNLYNADFAGAQKVINEALRQEPANAFYYAVRAAAYSFGEMNRLHILETDFFLDDENLSSKEKLKPDPRFTPTSLRRANWPPPGWPSLPTIATPCSPCAWPPA